ncbi:calphotin-like [Tenebrio molitor]|uniref:calphotin-like n=1 Tax=Tenebrio molitor TaxID=7067 RepID=UPI003624AB63
MKFMLSLLALGYVASASPVPSLPLHPGGIGGLYKGPNSETIIKGPDGSVITSAAVGGEVYSNVEPIVVPEPAVVQQVAPVVAPAVAAAPVIETVAVAAPVVESRQSSDLIGPSGRILTHGSQSVVAGPASTTVTGPAVVAETVVKGAPLVATPLVAPVSAVTAAPIATISGASLAPISLTLLAQIAPVSVTASPIAELAPISVTASPLPHLTRAELASGLATGGVHAGLGGGLTTTVTGVPLQAVATASASPHLSVASASSTHGASATASAVETTGITTVTGAPLPLVPPSIQGVNVGINDRIDLTSQLVQDQLALDNRQLTLNPALLPAANIIPPEISVTPKTIIGRVRPTPGTLLTTPGLGSVAGSSNIQRDEADIALRVTPTPVLGLLDGLTQQQLQVLQNQQVQNIQRDEADIALRVTPTPVLGLHDGLTQQQLQVLQNQQVLLNNQIQHAQQAADPGVDISRVAGPGVVGSNQLIGVRPSHELLPPPIADPRLVAGGNQVASLASIQQQDLLAAELAKSGIDASQLQLTNVPLSAVSGLPIGLGQLKGGVINDGLGAEAWGRYGRGANSKKI